MKLDEWLRVLRSASRPLDVSALYDGAQQIAARASTLAGGRVSFRVSTTGTGVRISADPPSMLAQRALNRAVGEQAASLREAVAEQGRERLRSG